MILTADDASYLVPAENYLRTGIWKDNSQGISSYVQRPPGMGFMHLVFYTISPENYPLLHKIFNLLLHVLQLYVFGLIAHILLSKGRAVFAQVFYAILPFFWGYLFYYLTESVTPALIVFLVFGYVKYHQHPASKWIIFQAAVSGILLLIRPQLIIFILPFIYFLWSYIREKHYRKWPYFLFAIVLAFGGFVMWQVRTATIVKKWTGMHPIYDVTNNTQYRPVHRSLGELYKIWEHDGEKFHSHLRLIWEYSLEDSSMLEFSILNTTMSFPKKVFKYASYEEFKYIFTEYYYVAKEIEPYSRNRIPVPGESPREKALRLKIDSLTHALKKKMWIESYITTPIHSAKFMFTKSHLNLYVFQHTYRGTVFMEITRFATVGLILMLTLLTLLQLFNKKNKPAFLLALATMAYLFYLFFVQKINEERYVFPLLPMFALMGYERLYSWIKRFTRK